MTDRLLTVADLAERHSVSRWTVYAWNSSGTGPRYTRPGNRVRYALADVIAWERAHEFNALGSGRPAHTPTPAGRPVRGTQ